MSDFMLLDVTFGSRTYSDLNAAMESIFTQVQDGFNKAERQTSTLLLQSLQTIGQQIVKQHSAGWNGSVFSSSPNLQRRSGEGLQSILDSIKSTAQTGEYIAVGQISAGALSFHEEGGTIRATRSQYLTIPLPAAMDPRGVPLRARARLWDYTFVKRSKAGNLIIFRRLPGARELTPLYILKTSVYIRPRLHMTDAVNTEMGYFETKLFEQISDIVDQEVK